MAVLETTPVVDRRGCVGMNVQMLTRDRMTANALASILGYGDVVSREVVCLDVSTLKNRLATGNVNLVLADVDPDPIENLDQLAPLVNGFRDTRFIAICSQPSHSVLLKAMQTGVRHVQTKSDMRAELPAVISQLKSNFHRHGGEHKGAIIVLLQASGGCGTTTLAVNLANELHLISGKRTLVIDMDEVFGSVGSYLDVSGQYGVSEVLSHGSGIDEQLIRSTSVRYHDGLHVLLSPTSTHFGTSEHVFAQDLHPLFVACKEAFDFTVVDAPRTPVTAASEIAATSETTLVVLQPLVKDVRFARTLCNELVARGVPTEKLRLVVNRYARRQSVPQHEIETALRGFNISTLRNDYSGASSGLNYGKPLSDQAKRSPLRKDIITLVQSLPVLARSLT